MRRTRRVRVTTVRTIPDGGAPAPILACPRCGVDVVTVGFAEVGRFLGLDAVGISGLVVTGALHLVETQNGDARVCGTSLETLGTTVTRTIDVRSETRRSG